MAKPHTDDPDEQAALLEGIAHAFRIAILNELRREKELSFGELRRRVAENYEQLDFRSLQFHLFKMQMAGIVEIGKRDGEGLVSLAKDVLVKVRPVRSNS